MKNLKFKTVFLCWLVGTLASCSSTWHLQKAIKKNPSIIQKTVDTFEVVVPGTTQTIYAKDSIVVDQEKFYIKAIANGDSLSLYFNIFQDTVFVVKEKVVFSAPKTRQQIRKEFKIEKLSIKKNTEIKKQEVKSNTKIRKAEIKRESKSRFFIIFLILSFLLGFLSAILLVRWAYNH